MSSAPHLRKNLISSFWPEDDAPGDGANPSTWYRAFNQERILPSIILAIGTALLQDAYAQTHNTCRAGLCEVQFHWHFEVWLLHLIAASWSEYSLRRWLHSAAFLRGPFSQSSKSLPISACNQSLNIVFRDNESDTHK